MKDKKLELYELRKRLARADMEYIQAKAHRESALYLIRSKHEIRLLRDAIRELERDLGTEPKQPWWVTMWKDKK